MRDLSRLLRPRSIAVIGGGVWCANVVQQCCKIGFAGEIWPVHPKRESVSNVPAFAGVADLPDAPDAAFIGVNRDATIEVVGALAARGAGGAVCFASGFHEAQGELGDGADKQAALLSAAGDMPILGPNCYGFLNYVDGATLWPDQHGGVQVDCGVAIVTQSSNIALNLTMQNRGLPLAYVVTVGNQAQAGISTVARTLLQDERVTALGLHIEGIDDLRAFEALAVVAAALGKPIVALKIGKSDHAQTAIVSHTASLAGSAAGASALFKRLGVGEVATLPEFVEALKLLHVVGPLASNRIASMSCSGGEASLMADLAHDMTLIFPPLDARQTSGLRKALGAKVALANPLDYHTYIWADVDAMVSTFVAMMRADLAIGCVVLDFPRADRCDPGAWEPVIEAVNQARAISGRSMAIVASLQETMPETIAARLVVMGIVPLSGMQEALVAIETAAQIGNAPSEAAPLLLPPAASQRHRTLTEAEAKAVLAAHGLRVPKSRRTGLADLADAAAGIGFPVVLKGEGIAHKTDVGAVVLDLHDVDAVEKAARSVRTNSFLVEEQITGAVVELLVGVVADVAHGYVLTLASGGVLTEIMRDSVSLLLPASREDVRAALDQLKSAPLLMGYRGAPAADLDAVLDAVMAVQAYVGTALPYEVEINPLMCSPDGAIAADALIRIGAET